MHSRKTYIACKHTSCHAKSCKKHEPPLHPEATCCAGGEAEGYKCPVVGRVLPPAGWYRFDRISRISSSPLTKASGQRFDCMNSKCTEWEEVGRAVTAARSARFEHGEKP